MICANLAAPEDNIYICRVNSPHCNLSHSIKHRPESVCVCIYTKNSRLICFEKLIHRINPLILLRFFFFFSLVRFFCSLLWTTTTFSRLTFHRRHTVRSKNDDIRLWTSPNTNAINVRCQWLVVAIK